MKTDKIIYWATTGIIGVLMLFSCYSYFTSQQVIEGFKYMGFPDFFRIELGAAKGLAAVVLLVPQIPLRVKEWAYAGLGITLISATILHVVRGDSASAIISPLVLFLFLIVSNIYLHKNASKSFAV